MPDTDIADQIANLITDIMKMYWSYVYLYYMFYI